MEISLPLLKFPYKFNTFFLYITNRFTVVNLEVISISFIHKGNAWGILDTDGITNCLFIVYYFIYFVNVITRDNLYFRNEIEEWNWLMLLITFIPLLKHHQNYVCVDCNTHTSCFCIHSFNKITPFTPFTIRNPIILIKLSLLSFRGKHFHSSFLKSINISNT